MINRRFLLAAAAASPCALSMGAVARVQEAEPRPFSGSILVKRRDEVLLRRDQGPARLGGDPRIDRDAQFKIASISKTFTATAVLCLSNQGRIDLDAPVTHYLRDAPDSWAAIPVRRLLNHSHGIRDIISLEAFPRLAAEGTSLPEVLALLYAEPLRAAPGSEFRYGNSGAVVAAGLIERLAGLPYEAVLERSLLSPLGLTSTGGLGLADPPPRLVDGLVLAEGRLASARPLNMSVTRGAGSLYSGSDDLHRWVAAVGDEHLLPAEVWRQVLTPEVNEFGLGWMVREMFGQREIGHLGDINGFGSWLARYPEAGVTVSILTNLEGTRVRDLGRRYAEWALSL
ncbi:serine hydrolase domain-containing protein [Brevundimonas sp. 2R-24]|uniref:Serine hydrolase domain-containing protein n=1 Tax=Peiella sedimenti TaxID=3061083 RepID=A0ABT8SKI5_9CAUL|nr:serine hydrolase domain-containing protein [Caulobacteraceae bacterium XZ-24]